MEQLLYFTTDTHGVLQHLAEAGEQVSVYCGDADRSTFNASISITGKLEQKGVNNFRVLVNEGTYTYFTDDDVERIVKRPDGDKFKDGSVAVIRITI
jgi:hypothetical protein